MPCLGLNTILSNYLKHLEQSSVFKFCCSLQGEASLIKDKSGICLRVQTQMIRSQFNIISIVLSHSSEVPVRSMTFLEMAFQPGF